jgi:hypothetical protein
MTIPVTFEIEGSVLIDNEIFNDARIIGVDHENKFLVLVYGPDGYHAHRVETVFYNEETAKQRLASRDRIKQGKE